MMDGQPFSQSFVLKTSIDIQNNKLYLEAIVTVMGSEQYSFVDIDYNFETEALISYRLCGNVMTSYYDMSLTSDDKNLWFSTEDATDEYSVAIMTNKAALADQANQISKLTTPFDNEIQTYMDVIQDVISNLT